MPVKSKASTGKKKQPSKAKKEAMSLIKSVKKTAEELGVKKPKSRGTVSVGKKKKKGSK